MSQKAKISLILLVFLIVLIPTLIFIRNNHYIMLYIDPNNDNTTYPYIAKVSKDINNILFRASELTNDNIFGIKTKVIYTNVYGSGILKNNKTSSDMDYGAGIYLGNYKYNGQNSKQIANTILRTIHSYHFNLLDEVDKSDKFFKKTKEYTILGFKKDNKEIVNILAAGVENAAAGTTYSVKVENRIFKILPDELLLSDYNYIKLYTDEILYYPNYRKMIRELTVKTSYFADITDEKSGITRQVEIIEETFNGKRFQSAYNQFVPHVFTDISSWDYVKNIVPEDNEKYLNMRLGDYLRHYNDIHFLNGIGGISPLKIVKRLLQYADILAPIIPKDKIKEIQANIYDVLSDKTVALINDYYVGITAISDILTSKDLNDRLIETGKFEVLLEQTNTMLKELEKDENITSAELQPLIKYQNTINKLKYNRNQLVEYVKANSEAQEIYLDKLMSAHIKNKEYFIDCNQYLADLLRKGGIRIIKLYQDPDNPKIVYVIKDENSKDIKLTEFSKIGLENAYYTYLYDNNTTFKFIEEKDFKGDILNIDPNWVRYKTTPQEDKEWEKIKDKLIKDKRNYRMKIRFGLIKS